ncbi:hypothetical protein DASC09_001740 [Saccharomycopsis crataegensis]|uniref:Proteasome assembly chaperone 1 n=1 Tax=Saccharomycopsis crataegensis TaxID=43959 RepID=A0AAV5QES9_9ASCO|nr:hypothetical protein DASC09_001740 [Saccharomycopsis crataegensis]
MLFKPWSEFERAPRHALSEDYQDEDPLTSNKVPSFKFSQNVSSTQDLEINRKNPLIVAPYNLKFVLDALPVTKSIIASITITKGRKSDEGSTTTTTSVNDDDDDDGYLQDQQLYSATGQSEAFSTFVVDILSLEGLQINVVAMPNFTNSHPMINNQLTRYLIEQILSPENILLLSPCCINYNESLGKVINFSHDAPLAQKFANISFLKPPHFVSGITASVMSFATLKNIPTVNLVLDSEGVANFERINEDSVLEIIQVLGKDYFKFDQTQYKKFRDVAVKKSSLNDYVTSGMYI